MRARTPLLPSSSCTIPQGSCWKVTSSTSPSERQDLKLPFKASRLSTCSHSVLARIQSLCQQGQLYTAILCLEELSLAAPHSVYISLLKACHRRRNFLCTHSLLTHLYVHGLEFTGFLGEHSVVALVKCKSLNEALHVFLRLRSRSSFAWTAIISGFTDHGSYQEALQMFTIMQDDRIEPDIYTFVSLFKACGGIQGLEVGRCLHAMARNKGFAMYPHAVSAMVSMYGKCGAIKEAENVFSGVPNTDVVSYNSLLSVYVEGHQAEKALHLYMQMLLEGLCPDKQTLIIALQACGTLATKEVSTEFDGDEHLKKDLVLEIGRSVDFDLQSKGFNTDISVITTLVSMYGKCGACHEAENVFKDTHSPGVVTCTAMLSAYIDGDEGIKALMLYRQMQRERILPTQHTLVCGLKACIVVSNKEIATFVDGPSVWETSLDLVKAIHSDARKRCQDLDIFVSNALISTYGKCDALKEAQYVFNKLWHPDVVSWTAMLSIYVDLGFGEAALQLYTQIQKEGWIPNSYTFVMAFKACAILSEKGLLSNDRTAKAISLEIVRALHVDAERSGFATDVFVATTLLSTYGKCGSIIEAKLFFESFPERDIEVRNAMLTTFVDHNQEDKALEMFKELQNQKFGFDLGTFTCVLQACTWTGSIDTCWKIHFAVISAGLELRNTVASALIHTYGRIARMVDAEMVAEGLPQSNLVSWNACITGYAGEGTCIKSFHTFEQLQQSECKPNSISFTSILCACSHAGLVEQGLCYFESMGRHCDITQEWQHLGSIVDLLGRAGDFMKVKNMLQEMSSLMDVNLWSCLLAACLTHGNTALGKWAFMQVLDLQPHQMTAYVLMSNLSSNWRDDIAAEEAQKAGVTHFETVINSGTSLQDTASK